ncbi:MAG TPA: T9SS type A sorting domain-containing protein [Candidatus Kapabacteria bacterium]|nr:T9SS type A sorting domain-containing protein [Candidatus Kapabacteria bacterium]
MKAYLAFIIICVLSVGAYSQTAGQVYITSYDDTVDKVYFCSGQRQNSVTTAFGMANLLYQTSPSVQIDSITFGGTLGSFLDIPINPSFTLSQIFYGSGPEYSPSHMGTDTLIITAYYGKYHSQGTVIFHAVESPSLGMVGYETTSISLGGGYSFGNDQQVISTDTMHDKLNGGLAYHVGDTAIQKGFNDAVRLRACGDVVIDSILRVGDFSEFQFHYTPQTPLTLHTSDSVIIKYDLMPAVVGKLHHYLVFHTTTGQYLVWSFEYKVNPRLGVFESSFGEASVALIPNPVSLGRGSIIVRNMSLTDAEYRIVDIYGKEMNGKQSLGDLSSDAPVPINMQTLNDGTYFLLLKTPQKLFSVKFVVVH